MANNVFIDLPPLSILDRMVQIGNPVKYDNYGRITCPADLAELLDLEKGLDEVVWYVEDGKAVIRKVTKTYAGGFDFESEEIESRLREYEEDHGGQFDEDIDMEEAEERARNQYEKDKMAREALKQSRRQN